MATELGRVGVWMASIGGASAEVEREVVRELDADGWPTLWFGEAPSNKDAFVHAGLLLAASERINIATGIANIWARDAMAARLSADALAEAYDSRFVLGLGVSHKPIVDIRGSAYGKPVATMRAYLEAYAQTTYAPPPPREPVTVLVAALRPKMLELSGELAAGAHPYFVPVEHTRRAREVLSRDQLLAPELGFVLAEDDATGLEAAGRFASMYLQLPNYVNNLKWLGYSDDDVAGSGSERLLRDTIAIGSVEDVVLRVAAHLDAGADHVCLQPIAPDLATARAWLRTLRPAVAEL